MLVKVCLLLLSVGVYASYADSSESTSEEELFDDLDVFPEKFLSRFPKEKDFFRTKILVYLFFNIFSKHFAASEPIKFWWKFNKNDFTRIAIDAVFYEYLTQFADRKRKPLVFNPLGRSTRTTEDIAIHRIGDYLDNLSADEVPAGQSETRPQATKTKGNKKGDSECVMVPLRDPSFGVAGIDFPNYCDIPKTSFTCANKPIPGLYADMETGCQVFHACWPDRIDSFLCPVGTIFNKALLTCDFWHESDCSSSPQPLEQSLFAKGKTPTSPSTSTPELDIPDYDGTCESLLGKPLQLHMKFLPAKCQVGVYKPSTPKATSKPRKFDEAEFSRASRFATVLSELFKDVLVSVLKEGQKNLDVVKSQGVAKRPQLKMKTIPKSDSRIVEEATEVVSEPGEIQTRSEEQMSPSTTERPSENLPESTNSRFVEEPVIETTSQGKVRLGKTREKLNKLSEDSKRHVLDVIMKTLELGGNVMSDDLLPFIEKMVLESPGKMSNSEKS